MSIAHIGIAIFIIGATFSTLFGVERDVRVEYNNPVELAGYTFVLKRINSFRGPNYDAVEGEVELLKEGVLIEVLKPQKRNYSTGMPMSERRSILALPVTSMLPLVIRLMKTPGVCASTTNPLFAGSGLEVFSCHWVACCRFDRQIIVSSDSVVNSCERNRCYSDSLPLFYCDFSSSFRYVGLGRIRGSFPLIDTPHRFVLQSFSPGSLY
jgi:hypothetical protein